MHVCVCQVQAGCRGIETTTQTSIIKPWDATKSRLEGNLQHQTSMLGKKKGFNWWPQLLSLKDQEEKKKKSKSKVSMKKEVITMSTKTNQTKNRNKIPKNQ